MTLRAVILGMLGALLLAAVGYLNDQVVVLGSITAGSLLPISVFGVLFLVVILINPLLYYLPGARRLRSSELAVIVLLMMVACSIASRGLLDTFTPAMMMPLYYYEIRPGWKDLKLLDYAPRQALPCGAQYHDQTVRSFMEGLGRPGDPIGLADVPWSQWTGPLMTWMPLAVLMAVAATCIALIVHRQWSKREHLRYPIAEFATSLMAQDDDRATGSIFRNRIFWLGLAIVLGIRVINGLAVWYPSIPQIPMMFNFLAIRDRTPGMWGTMFGHYLLVMRLYPTIVAFSFFLSSEIALSLGLSQWILIPVASYLIAHGVDFSEGYMSGGVTAWQRSGSFLAFALIIVYMGRRHYWLVLKGAFTFRRHPEVEGYTTWACRVGLLAVAAVVAILIALGLDWPMAILTVGLMLMTFVCVARITAETGMFVIDPRWQPLGVLLGLFGAYALGPETIVIVGLACAALSLGPGQTLLPYLVNGLKMSEDAGVKPRRVGPVVMATFVLCLVLAMTVILWANYNFGVKYNNFTTDRVPTMTFRAAASAVHELRSWGGLEASKGLGPLESLSHMRPSEKFLWSAGAGFLLVLVVGALRQRMPRWPLHPVMFLVWGTYPAAMLNHSFLLGWLICRAVTRFAGPGALRKAKPFMIGVIAGDLLGGAIFMVVGAVYYGLTGDPPPAVEIFP